MAIGSRLREIRRENGLTLLDVVAATDLSAPYVSRVERGEVLANPETFARIAEAADVPSDVLAEMLENLLFERARTELQKAGYEPDLAELAAALGRLRPADRKTLVKGTLAEAADRLPAIEALHRYRRNGA